MTWKSTTRTTTILKNFTKGSSKALDSAGKALEKAGEAMNEAFKEIDFGKVFAETEATSEGGEIKTDKMVVKIEEGRVVIYGIPESVELNGTVLHKKKVEEPKV